MCGICGFTGHPDRDLLRGMGNQIYHRGPDAEGIYQDDQISLCSRRLSIVDLEGGNQPCHNEDGSLLSIWNGEIYNYRTLFSSLRGRHQFCSDHSDSELLVHLYEEYGEEFVHQLNGMFAIALWNKKDRSLTLIRDRLGVKPLFYYYNGSDLIFASEIKSILLHPLYQKKINVAALYHYFSFQTICHPYTAFSGIMELAPGELLRWQHGHIQLRTYWKPDCRNTSTDDFDTAVDKTRELLCDATKLRLNADVEPGCFLSGGLDSSLITAIASQSMDSLKTFTLGHECTYQSGLYEKDADVSYAQKLADELHTNHTCTTLRPQDLMDEFDHILTSFDQPFSGSFSTFFLSRTISQNVKMALSGDGADELFGSYLPHRLANPFAYYSACKKKGLLPFEMDDRLLRPFDRGDQLIYLDNLYVSTGGDERKLMGQLLNSSDEWKSMFLSPDVFGNLIEQFSTKQLLDQMFSTLSSSTPLSRVMEFQFCHAFPDQVLAFTDSLSMAHSLEVRSPFMDYRLVEYLQSLPDHYKIHNGETKYLLKKAAEPYLPQDLIYRKKEGFVQPTHDWMRAELKPFISDTLSTDSIRRHGYLDASAVQFLLQKYYESDKVNHPLGDILWNLVCFERWADLYL